MDGDDNDVDLASAVMTSSLQLLLEWSTHSPCLHSTGRCSHKAAAVAGRCARKASVFEREINPDQLQLVEAQAARMERLSGVLEDAVKWVEAGRNGRGRDDGGGSMDNAAISAANAVLTDGLVRVAKAKPDSGGHCNSEKCVLAGTEMIERTLASATTLTRSVGEPEIKRILKSAVMLRTTATDLHWAISKLRALEPKP